MVADKLPKLLDAGIIDCAIVHGGMESMRKAFEVINQHKRGADIALLIDYAGDRLSQFQAASPRANVAGVNFHPIYEMGVRAARAICKFLDDGQALGRIEVPYSIEAPDWRWTANSF